MTETKTEKNEHVCKAAAPQKEHQWLTALAGDWTFESECSMGPDQPPMKSGGKETIRTIGGLWILGDGEATMPDGELGTTMITLGYDPAKKRYLGTWVGSMMNHLWIYDGEMDASGKILTLNAEGPSFSDPTKSCMYQDIIEVKDASHRILRSQYQGENGEWTHFMTAHYRRKV